MGVFLVFGDRMRKKEIVFERGQWEGGEAVVWNWRWPGGVNGEEVFQSAIIDSAHDHGDPFL
jgi:hypothetical protein